MNQNITLKQSNEAFFINNYNFKKHTHSLLFSEKLEDTYFLYEQLKNIQKNKKENYKQINLGLIPPINLNSNQINTFQANIHFLDYKNLQENIFNKLQILDKIFDKLEVYPQKCPQCNNKLTKSDLTLFSKNIINSYVDDTIAIGTYEIHEGIINIKQLLKNEIFNIISDNKLIDIDEIKDAAQNDYLYVTGKFLISDTITIFEQLKNTFQKLFKYNQKIFIFSIKNQELKIYDLNNRFICTKCHYETNLNNISEFSKNFIKNNIEDNLESISNICFNGITLDKFLTTPFESLISQITDLKFKNILASLISLGLGDLCFLSKIKNLTTNYILNYIKIKDIANKNELIIIQNPLSFITSQILKNILDNFNNYTVIVFENNCDIFSLKFNTIYNQPKNVKISHNLGKNTDRILLKNINVMKSNLVESILSNPPKDFKKDIIIEPVFTKNTILACALDIFKDINNIFQKTVDAKILGLSKKDFLLNNNKYLCKKCLGKGKIKVFNELYRTCPTCNGNLFNKTILNLKFKELSLNDVYNLNLTDANSYFSGFIKITKPISYLIKLGLSNLKLNSSTDYMTPDIINQINIISNFSKLSEDNLYIIKNSFSFLSNSKKIRFINIIEEIFKNNTIILESI